MPAYLVKDGAYVIKDRAYFVDTNGTDCCCQGSPDPCWQIFRACATVLPLPDQEPCLPGPDPDSFQVDCSDPEVPFPTDQVVRYLGDCYRADPPITSDPGLPVVPSSALTTVTGDCVECCDQSTCFYNCFRCPPFNDGTIVSILCDDRDAHPTSDAFVHDAGPAGGGAFCYDIPAGSDPDPLGPVVTPSLWLPSCVVCDPDPPPCCSVLACDSCPTTLILQISGIDFAAEPTPAPCNFAIPCDGFTTALTRTVGTCNWSPPVNCPNLGAVVYVCTGTLRGFFSAPNDVILSCEQDGQGVKRWKVTVSVQVPDVLGPDGFPCSGSAIEFPGQTCGAGVNLTAWSSPIDPGCPCPTEVSFAIDQTLTPAWLWPTSVTIS